MVFSKSFGYAVRGVLYVALMQDEKQYVQVEEIASSLAVPRHFMGKIMKRLVKEKVLASSKGRSGGFTINDTTLELPLIRMVEITEGAGFFHTCLLNTRECNATHPCPLHFHVEHARGSLREILAETRIGDLLKEDKADFIHSICTLQHQGV